MSQFFSIKLILMIILTIIIGISPTNLETNKCNYLKSCENKMYYKCMYLKT